MKLLDIYRTTSHVTDFKMPSDVCEEVSAFMQEEMLEPLALFAPSAEEAVKFILVLPPTHYLP
jgi:hypothetical protein